MLLGLVLISHKLDLHLLESAYIYSHLSIALYISFQQSGRESEIRTQGRLPVGGLVDRWFKPLTQLSRLWHYRSSHVLSDPERGWRQSPRQHWRIHWCRSFFIFINLHTFTTYWGGGITLSYKRPLSAALEGVEPSEACLYFSSGCHSSSFTTLTSRLAGA